jgi:hypothetical protein
LSPSSFRLEISVFGRLCRFLLIFSGTEEGSEEYQIYLERINRAQLFAQQITSNIENLLPEFCQFVHLNSLIEGSHAFTILLEQYLIDPEEISGDAEVQCWAAKTPHPVFS